MEEEKIEVQKDPVSIEILYDPVLAEQGELVSSSFWKCDCSGTDAIHPIEDKKCDICDAEQEDSSQADVSEVIQFAIEEGVVNFTLAPAEDW